MTFQWTRRPYPDLTSENRSMGTPTSVVKCFAILIVGHMKKYDSSRLWTKFRKLRQVQIMTIVTYLTDSTTDIDVARRVHTLERQYEVINYG